MSVTLKVNGKSHTVDVDAATPLLYILRNDLGLQGPRFGCGLGQCGACTVIMNGAAIRSCIIPVSAAKGEITTLEGECRIGRDLAAGDRTIHRHFVFVAILYCFAFLLSAQDVPSAQTPAATSTPSWQYGGFIDLGYSLDFNHPANGVFRSRGTAWHVDEVDLNMAAAYLKKKTSEESRWGTELAVQAGKDTEVFGFSATAPNLPGYRALRHVGLANVSYLAPVGKGLTMQGGIFGSLVGYDGLYAKDNFEYTRPWGADFTPYLMLGVNASYPLSEKLTGTLFAVNGYWHLANANSVPSSGGQLAYKASSLVTVKQTGNPS